MDNAGVHLLNKTTGIKYKLYLRHHAADDGDGYYDEWETWGIVEE